MSDKNLIYGRNAVMEAISSGGSIEKLMLQKNITGEGKKLFALAKKAKIPVQPVPKFVLDKETGGAAHQGVAAYISDYEYSDMDAILALAKRKGERPFLLLLDGIEDPHNLGAILRSAECAGVHGVLIPKNRAAQVNGTVVKTSAGATAHIKIARITNPAQTLKELKEKSLWVFGLDMDGTPYKEADFSGDGGIVLVIGSEGAGLSRIVKETCDFLVSIPMRGKISSLNASVAAAVVMFEAAERL